MPELERLRADHAEAVLAFESANRAYFASSISDRGDEYFETFAERHHALLAEQDAGIGAYYVLVDEGGARPVQPGVRRGRGRAVCVAQQVTGRGVATAAVRDLCLLASSRHGVSTLRAATSHENVASQRVLLKAGFVKVGVSRPIRHRRQAGQWFERDLRRA